MTESPSAPEKADEVLIEEVKRGDRSAFEVLYVRYRNRIFNYLYYLTGHKQMAEDTAQDVLIRVYERAAQFKSGHKFSSWLYGMARNTAMDALRKSKVRRASSLDKAVSEDDASTSLGDLMPDQAASNLLENMAAQERLEILKGAIARLPDTDRELIVLCEIEELKQEEVAQILEYKKESIPVMLYRAKAKLKKIMKQQSESGLEPS